MIFRLLIFVCCFFTYRFGWAQVQVDDFLGRKVSLPKPAARVVVLAPHIAENVASAGGSSLIVGAVDYCDYPTQVKSVPRVGSYNQFSLESIIALKPDLVVVWTASKGGAVLDQLESLGIPTYASDPRKLEDVAEAIRDYGVLMGTEKTAMTTANQFEKRLHRLRELYADQAQMSILYQVWFDPLQTLNHEHIISDVIELCGGINAFGDLPVLAPKISVESVIARDPDVIIASGMSDARPDWLDMWRKWPNLNAVRQGQLYFIPPDILQRHTERLLDGAQMMCEQLEGARQYKTKNKTNKQGSS